LAGFATFSAFSARFYPETLLFDACREGVWPSGASAMPLPPAAPGNHYCSINHLWF
jgi:hypothetical protein